MKKIIFVVLLCCLYTMLTGCAKQHPDTNATDVKLQFLTLFFTSDDQKRYSTLIKADDITDEDVQNTYYKELSSLVTTACLDTLKKNREPLKYDKQAADKGEQLIPVDISVKIYDKKNSVYTFTLTLKDSSGKEKDQFRKGQLTTLIFIRQFMFSSVNNVWRCLFHT